MNSVFDEGNALDPDAESERPGSGERPIPAAQKFARLSKWFHPLSGARRASSMKHGPAGDPGSAVRTAILARMR